MPNTGGTGSESASEYAPLPSQFQACDNWLIYKERIEQFFVAYNITKMERMRAMLLTALSEDVYDTLMNLCLPDKPETKTLKELYGMMKLGFSPVICVLDERCKFYKAEQQQGESIVSFAARLKGLTRHCKFDTYLQNVLRDKFISGLAKGPVASKVLELEHTATFEECIEVALKKELAVAGRNASEVYKISRVSSQLCSACGGTNHESQRCKYRSYECKICKVKGHLAKVCKRKINSENNHLENDSDSDSLGSMNSIGLH